MKMVAKIKPSYFFVDKCVFVVKIDLNYVKTKNFRSDSSQV